VHPGNKQSSSAEELALCRSWNAASPRSASGEGLGDPTAGTSDSPPPAHHGGGGDLTSAGGFFSRKGTQTLPACAWGPGAVCEHNPNNRCLCQGSVCFTSHSKPSPAEPLCSPAQGAFSPPWLLPGQARLCFRSCWAQDGPHGICTFACACVSLVMLLFTLHAKTGLALASQEQMWSIILDAFPALARSVQVLSISCTKQV